MLGIGANRPIQRKGVSLQRMMQKERIKYLETYDHWMSLLFYFIAF